MTEKVVEIQNNYRLKELEETYTPNTTCEAHLGPDLYKFNGKMTLLRHLGKSEHDCAQDDMI